MHGQPHIRFTTSSSSTSNPFPQRLISSDAIHHKTLQYSGLRWLQCCSPGSKGGRVSTKTDLSGDVGSTKISKSFKRIPFAYKTFSIPQTIFFSLLGKQPTCTSLGSTCAGHKIIVPRSKGAVNNETVTNN